jgi:serine/threonine-protein kinase
MELIEGGTLQDLLARARQRRIPLAQDFGLFVVSEILEGLNALHSASSRTGRELGLVHRDITPSNIFLSFDGRAVLGDLGALHIQAYGESNPNVVLGKIGYLAPEMVLGEDIDRRADIFAVGVVLYELITSSRLFFGGSDEELMEQIAEVRIARPRRLNPHISRELENIVMRALSRRPKERFETAEEMMYELTTCWSKQIANPYGLAAMMAALYKEEVAAWWLRREASKG